MFVALATQLVLRLLGAAIGLSVGDRTLGDGYAVWSVLVQLFALGLGAGFAAYLENPANPLDGEIV